MKRFLLFLFLLCAAPCYGQMSTSGTIGQSATTCASLYGGGCLGLALFNSPSVSTTSATITLAGSFTATIQFEASGDNALTWNAIAGTPIAGGAPVTSATATGTWAFTVGALTHIRARASAWSSAPTVTIQASAGTVATSGGGSGQNGLGSAGPNPQSALYTVYVNGGTVYARNNSTGNIDYSGTDAGPVINNIMAANISTCGTIKFRQGDYSFNSMTLESTGGYSNFYYAVGIPANAGSANQYCMWIFEGDQGNTDVSGLAAQAQGVIFDVTAAAITSCGTSTHECIAWWHRPDTTNHIGNDVVFKNITTRFPANTRGNEAAYLMWEAATVDYETATASLAVAMGTGASPSISPASPVGTNHMIGMSSSITGHNNWMRFINTWVFGYDIAYDIESEHSIMEGASAQFNNYFAYYGRLNSFGSYTSALLFHPGVWTKVTDQENLNGIVFGSNTSQGSRLDILGYDIEAATSGTFTRVTNLTETNLGYSTGLITYTVVEPLIGTVSETPANTLFSAGGQGFQLFEGTVAPNIALVPGSDTFTRANQTGLGPAWTTPFSTLTCNIVSNAATGAISGCGNAWIPMTSGNDQFSKATVAALDVNGESVATNISLAAVTRYTYGVSSSGAGCRAVKRTVAGTPTTLATSNTCAATTHTLQLDSICNNPACSSRTLIPLYDGVIDVNLGIVQDATPITGGYPGIYVFSASNNADSFTNWTGGNLIQEKAANSIYSQPMIAQAYYSIGVPPVPTGTGACATITTQVPATIGSVAGTFKCTGTTGASTMTLTFVSPAPNGWRCSADDETTVADRPSQTSYTTTTCVLTSAALVQNDIIAWNASPF